MQPARTQITGECFASSPCLFCNFSILWPFCAPPLACQYLTLMVSRPKALHDNSASNKAADAIMMSGLSSDVVGDLSRVANPDWVEEQNFPLLHRIVLGFHGKDL